MLDTFEDSNTRKYVFRQDGVSLDNESRKDFLSAIIIYEKLEARRNDEEARACALITSSFSEEANAAQSWMWYLPQKVQCNSPQVR